MGANLTCRVGQVLFSQMDLSCLVGWVDWSGWVDQLIQVARSGQLGKSLIEFVEPAVLDCVRKVKQII